MSKTPTNQEIQNFQPKCLLPSGPAAGRPPAERQGVSVTSSGFVLPCCWLASSFGPDNEEQLLEDEKIKSFFDKELHIDNNETIEDIVNSNTWLNFMSDLVNKPEKSSPLCFERCSKVEKK